MGARASPRSKAFRASDVRCKRRAAKPSPCRVETERGSRRWASSRSPSAASHCPRMLAVDRQGGGVTRATRREAACSLQLGKRSGRVLDDEPVVIAQRLMALRALRPDRQRLLRGLQRPSGPGRRRSAVGVEQRRGTAEPRPRLQEAGVERNRLLVVADGPPEARRIAGRHRLRGLLTAQIGLVSRQVPGRLLLEFAFLSGRERDVERLCHPRGDLPLHLEDVRQRRVERLPPPRRRARGQTQLRAHLHAPRAVASLREADGAREQVLDVQLLPDFLRLLLRLPVSVRAGARDDLQARQVRQLPAHLVRDAVGEVVVLFRAEVLEGEDGQALDTGVGLRDRGCERPARDDDRSDDDGGDDDCGSAERRDETAAPERNAARHGERRPLARRSGQARQRLQIEGQIVRRLSPCRRALLEAMPQHPLQPRRDVRVRLRQLRGLVPEDGRHACRLPSAP